MKFAAIGLALVLAAGGGGYWYLNHGLPSAGDYGPATATADATDVSFEWFLTDGELALGNEDIRAPQGINVVLKIDSDSAESIEIDGLGVIAPIASDAVTAIRFHAYKLGRYTIRLSSNGAKLGTLEIYQGA